ncbi:SRPBCC family protein [Pseudonocardia humida]|uniref:SRPBCC domain-containing protein n=1 Tax=Pseudonocardia humida TaxID=2800819 RepID=A0ABT1A8W2_9PSEU|nr:SRPBCC domain-containing protein [Pseudonocardia humida]MCO1659376.1 SRPBCC domain-containing protein [Pseudonocardia humida]
MTERKLEKSYELDASPEQVWDLIATGPGISTWFVPHEVEQREGGAVKASFGGAFTGTGRVSAWEPGRRFGYAEQRPGDSPDVAFEFLVEGRDGGGAVLRFVQSGFAGEHWEDEYDSFDKGWSLFFENLRSYLEHFAGQPVHNVVSMVMAPGSQEQVWPVLHRGLGLDGHPAVGERVALTGPQELTGVVDVSTPEFLGVRSAHGLHRIGAEGDAGCGVSAYHYFYGEPVDTETLTKAWDAWLAELFPQPART